MKRVWLSAVCVATMGLVTSVPAGAQVPADTQVPADAQVQPYETPQYMPAPEATLDKNFSLPTFGMPGSELPQQKTMATERPPPKQPDVFANTFDLILPKPQAAAGSNMVTPPYTTSFGSRTDDTTRLETGGLETGGLETGGMETETPAGR